MTILDNNDYLPNHYYVFFLYKFFVYSPKIFIMLILFSKYFIVTLGVVKRPFFSIVLRRKRRTVYTDSK